MTDRLNIRVFGLLQGAAEGRFAIAALAAMVLLVSLMVLLLRH